MDYKAGITEMDISMLLDDIIDNIQPEDVPAIYITMAKITDINGYELIIRGSELEEFLQNPKIDIVEIRFVLNIRKMKLAIMDEFKEFIERIDSQLSN